MNSRFLNFARKLFYKSTKFITNQNRKLNLFNIYYLNTLHENKSGPLGYNQIINKIKLFDKDKLIITTFMNNIFIFNISINKILYQSLLPFDLSMYDIEIIDNKKFILYNNNYNIYIYEFKEELINNAFIYNLIKINSLKILRVNKVFYIDYKIICLTKGIDVYSYNNNIIDHQLKIKTSFFYIDGFKFNNKIICTLKNYQNNLIIEFWNIINFSILQKYEYIYNNYWGKNYTRMLNLNNNDKILLALINTIYLYSFKINSIVKKIDFNYGFILEVKNIKALYPLNDNEIYILYNNDINILNLKTEFIYPITQWKYEFNNFCFLPNNENILTSVNNKIILFGKSKYKTNLYTIIICLLSIFINYFVKYLISVIIMEISFKKFYFIYNLIYIYYIIRMRNIQIIKYELNKKDYIGFILLFIFTMVFPFNILIFIILIFGLIILCIINIFNKIINL